MASYRQNLLSLSRLNVDSYWQDSLVSRAKQNTGEPEGSAGLCDKRGHKNSRQDAQYSAGGAIYIVATPIGNLEDITLRALRILGEADIIAAENTRQSKKLLRHFNIKKPMLSYHKHNIRQAGEEILSRLREGLIIALVSDAGTPCISDPGAEIAALAAAAGFSVSPVPGVSALITAFSTGGISADKFVFEGFLPRLQKERRKTLEALSKEKRTLVFYEAPHRLNKALDDMALLWPQRKMTVCRELTKVFEEHIRKTVSECRDHFKDTAPKGEFVLIVEGYKGKDTAEYTRFYLENEMAELMRSGFSRREAAKNLGKTLKISSTSIYNLSLAANKSKNE
jgi:16S rRNA (cytidine1402-2'-O)-methyltransferase